jgi:hypothetical protein
VVGDVAVSRDRPNPAKSEIVVMFESIGHW